MPGEVIVKHEHPPKFIPTTELPPITHEVAKNALEGSSSAGFRTAKYTPEEYIQQNYAKYYQSYTDRENAERNQHESKKLMNETLAMANRTQSDSTKKMGERLHDIGFWKYELQRQIEDMLNETEALLGQLLRLEKAKDATEVPLEIAFDNMRCRDRRYMQDLCRDMVEVQLLKEINLIKSVQDLYNQTIEQTKTQIRENRAAKHVLEGDWSDKLDSYTIDDKCGRLKNQSTDIEYFCNSAKFEDNASTPETWAQFTHDNIVKAEKERMASINLRSLIDNVLNDASNDLRNQCNAVNEAFQARCEELDDDKNKMENHLAKTLVEIGNQEKNIANLKQAIFDKKAPMQVAQTRLDHRTYRPNVELCRDPVQYRLVTEVGELDETIALLNTRLAEAENSLASLQDTRLSLEREVACKNNSLFIDRNKCMTYRARWPTIIKLSGY